MLAVPFAPLPLDAWQKGAIAAALFVLTEVAFFAAVFLVGKEVIVRFLKKLWPASWFRVTGSTTEFPKPEQQRGDQRDPEQALRPGDEHDRPVEDHEREKDPH